MQRRDLPILLFLILAPPVGVALMYRRGLFSEDTRLTAACAATALWLAVFIGIIAVAQASVPKLPAVYMLPPETAPIATPAPSPTAVPTPTPSPTVEPTAAPEPTTDPTPVPSPEPTIPAKAENPDDTVHITPSGKRYHEENCSTLARSKNITTLSRSDAESRGLTPCQVCTP